MKRPLVIAVFSTSLAGALAHPALALTPQGVLALALKGPTVPFSGQQKSTVYFEAGPVTSQISICGDGKGRTRREYQKGAAAGVVMLQSGAVTWQQQGSGGWMKLPGAPPPDASVAAARIARNYAVTAGAETSMLGRSVVPLKVAAKEAYNPSRRLWVDPKTGVILKDDLYAPGGRMRSSTVFTRLTLRPQLKSLFTAPAASAKPDLFGPSSFQRVISAAQAERLSGRPMLYPKHVPSGYRIETYGVMTTRNGRYMPAIRYSDGLSAFTIFQRGPGADSGGGMGRGPGRGMGRGRGMGTGMGRGMGLRGGPGGSMGGGMHAPQSDRQRSVVIASGTRSNYLLVGDIAEGELRRIADSMP